MRLDFEGNNRSWGEAAFLCPISLASSGHCPLIFSILCPMDKEDWTQEIEQRAQWSAPAWAAYCALYSISCVTSSLSTGYKILQSYCNFHSVDEVILTGSCNETECVCPSLTLLPSHLESTDLKLTLFIWADRRRARKKHCGLFWPMVAKSGPLQSITGRTGWTTASWHSISQSDADVEYRVGTVVHCEVHISW